MVNLMQFAKELWPLNRSLTGRGVRETLKLIQRELPDMTMHEIPSGVRVCDWVIPAEWNCHAARLTAPDGTVLCDYRACNLSVVGYSTPVNCELSLEQLQPHLYSLPLLPNAIPYVTSYYSPTWGFCLPHAIRENLPNGRYHAAIDAALEPGSLTLAELFIPGETEDTVLLSSYICHPSMANNELSGPVVLTALAQWICARPRRLSYRIVFAPETIGPLAYVSIGDNLAMLQQTVIAGYVLTCVGDDRSWTFMSSRRGNTLADRTARIALQGKAYAVRTWGQRGSDERQWCAPGIDLPVASVMRSAYGSYPEYHTNLDRLGTVVTKHGLDASLSTYQCILTLLEHNRQWTSCVAGEPMLSKRGLYPTTSMAGTSIPMQPALDVLSWCDGATDTLSIIDQLKYAPDVVLKSLELLQAERLIEERRIS